MGEPGIFCALGNANRGFLKNDVDAFHYPAKQLGVADVAFNNRDSAAGHCWFEILASSGAEFIEHEIFLVPLGTKSMGDMRPDQPRPAGNQCSLMIHRILLSYPCATEQTW